MKVSITGHTSGLGKELSTLYTEYLGFSRSNGFDLTMAELRSKTIAESADCDIFFNNAPIGWAQIELLYELWEHWKDKDRLIVNIGSNSAEYNQNFAKPYTVQKRALQDACLQMQHSTNKCKVMIVQPGYIDTPRVQSIVSAKINPKELALFIQEMAERRNSSFWIPTITIYPK